MAINVNTPISWREFRNLEKEEQHDYLQHLIDEYGANAVSFAEMFQVSPQTVRKYISTADIGITLSRGTRVDAVRWAEFLGGDADNAQPANPSEMQIRALTMQFSGKIDVDVIAESLRKIFDGVSDGKVEISCQISGEQ